EETETPWIRWRRLGRKRDGGPGNPSARHDFRRRGGNRIVAPHLATPWKKRQRRGSDGNGGDENEAGRSDLSQPVATSAAGSASPAGGSWWRALAPSPKAGGMMSKGERYREQSRPDPGDPQTTLRRKGGASRGALERGRERATRASRVAEGALGPASKRRRGASRGLGLLG